MPVIRQIAQLSPTTGSVITLGHTTNVPLMGPPSELSYRSEPHGHVLLLGHRGSDGERDMPWVGGVPGVVPLGGYREGCIPGTEPEAGLRLI